MPDKPDWYYRQSAAIPIYNDMIVLITAIKSKKWIIPKGIIDQGMSPKDSAAKEAREEAGVIGKIGSREIGQYQYDKWGGTCRVKVYPLHVEKLLDNWDEKGQRQRKIVPLKKALAMIDNQDLCQIMQRYFNNNE